MKNTIGVYIGLLFLLVNVSFAQSYITYPLNLGDYWQYEKIYLNEYYSYEVVGDTTFLSNGLTYKILQSGTGGKSYKRFFEDKVYNYYTSSEEEELIYDFTLQPGDTVAIYIFQNDSLIITLEIIKYTYLFGLDRKQWVFLWDIPNLMNEEMTFTITDGICQTSFSNMYEQHDLIGAIINGTTYGTIVSTDNDIDDFPRKFILSQNYPNPFNPTTTINYHIPDLPAGRQGLSFVTLKVYDVLGNEIAILVNEEKPLGSYEVDFNATGLPSGIYFYKLKVYPANGGAGSFVETKKMVLMK